MQPSNHPEPMPAAPAPGERRPYAPPRLSVHGSVAELTADLPEVKVGASDIA